MSAETIAAGGDEANLDSVGPAVRRMELGYSDCVIRVEIGHGLVGFSPGIQDRRGEGLCGARASCHDADAAVVVR
jgi:hypothetical protein